MTDEPEAPHGAPVVVATFATVGEAEVVQAELQSFGIEAGLGDHVAGGTVPVDGERGVNVLVRAVDAGRASEILAGEPDSQDSGDS